MERSLTKSHSTLSRYGSPCGVVAGVAGEDRLDAGLVALEHEGAAADEGSAALKSPNLSSISGGMMRSTARPDCAGRAQGVGQVDADRVLVRRLDLSSGPAGAVGRLLDRAVERVLHVGGDQLAPIDRRPRLPVHAGTQRDRIDRPSVETSALSARSGTRVKSEGPYLAPLTNLKSVRLTKDETSWVWYEATRGCQGRGLETDVLEHAAALRCRAGPPGPGRQPRRPPSP